MRGNRVKLSNVPLGAWIFASVALLGGLAAVVVLSLSHADTTDTFRFLNLAWNAVQIVATGGAVVYAGAAARNSQDAAEQTNGLLDEERHNIAQDAAQKAIASYVAQNKSYIAQNGETL